MQNVAFCRAIYWWSGKCGTRKNNKFIWTKLFEHSNRMQGISNVNAIIILPWLLLAGGKSKFSNKFFGLNFISINWWKYIPSAVRYFGGCHQMGIILVVFHTFADIYLYTSICLCVRCAYACSRCRCRCSIFIYLPSIISFLMYLRFLWWQIW